MIRNYLSLIGSQTSSRLISFFWVVYMARALGVTDYGRYGTILSITAIFTTFIDFGVSFVVIREISLDRDKAPRLIGFQLIQRLALAMLSAVAILGYAWVKAYSADYLWLFGLAIVHMTATALATVGDTVFAAYRRQSLIGLMNFLQAAGWALLGYTALRLGGGLRDLFTVMVVNSSLIFVIYAVLVRRYVRPSWTIDRKEAATLIQWSLPVGLTGVFGMAYDRIDRILLSSIQDSSQVGFYNAVMTLLMPFADMAWSASIIILFPYMPGLYQRLPDFIRVFRSVLSWLLAMFLPIIAGAVLFSTPIIRFIFGDQFRESASIMPVAVLFMIFLPFHGLMGRILIIQNRQKYYAWSNFFALLINVGTNVLLIPRWGAIGSAIACVITHASLMCLYAAFGRVNLRPFVDPWRIAQLLVCTGIAGGVAWGIPGLHVILRLVILLIVYVPLACWALRLNADWPEVRRLVTT